MVQARIRTNSGERQLLAQKPRDLIRQKQIREHHAPEPFFLEPLQERLQHFGSIVDAGDHRVEMDRGLDSGAAELLGGREAFAGRAQVNAALCKGCGLCVASCRSGALNLRGFEERQIMAMIDEM